MNVTVTSKDAEAYQRGRDLGESWIREGGNLTAGGPDDDVNPAFFNGFIDRLSEERLTSAQ